MYRWRHNITALLMIVAYTVLGTVLWGTGIVPGTGFARAAETNQVLAELKADKIYERKKEWCHPAATQQQRDSIRVILEQLRREHRQLSGEAYAEPECSGFVYSPLAAGL